MNWPSGTLILEMIWNEKKQFQNISYREAVLLVKENHKDILTSIYFPNHVSIEV